MTSQLHLRPDRLREHAAAAAGLADELGAAGRGAIPAEPEVDRLRAAVRRAAGELAELSVALSAAASAAERADRATARSLAALPHAWPRLPPGGAE